MDKLAPPGTIWLKDSLYIDITEVTNKDYREYTLWLNKYSFFEKYKKALPDTLVWRRKLAYNEPYVEYYFRHPAYNGHPVIGVSPQQAEDYCKWRSDRTKEYFLMLDGKVSEIDLVDPDKRSLLDSLIAESKERVRFRLPAKKEWELAAKADNQEAIFPWEGNSFLDKKGNPKANCMTNYNKWSYVGKLNNNNDFLQGSDSYYPNYFGLYCMGGNAAEMVYKDKPVDITEKTKLEDIIILKGGSWRHASFHAMINIQASFEGVTDYTGFRCVCEYKPF